MSNIEVQSPVQASTDGHSPDDHAVKQALTNVERLQKEFIAALQKDGMAHTFEWASGWFDKLGAAMVEDELRNGMGEHAKDPQAVNLFYMDRVMQMASNVSNHSNMASSNMLRQARLAAMATAVDRNKAHCYGSGANRREAWKTWEEKPESIERHQAALATAKTKRATP